MIVSTCPSVTSPVSGLVVTIAVRGSSSRTGTCSVVAVDSPGAGATGRAHGLIIGVGRQRFAIEVAGDLHDLRRQYWTVETSSWAVIS
jgi:hypothetical protein